MKRVAESPCNTACLSCTNSLFLLVKTRAAEADDWSRTDYYGLMTNIFKLCNLNAIVGLRWFDIGTGFALAFNLRLRPKRTEATSGQEDYRKKIFSHSPLLQVSEFADIIALITTVLSAAPKPTA